MIRHILALLTIFPATGPLEAASFPCFNFHGSIADDIGHPSYRLNPETKDGLLAVRDGDGRPINLWRLIPHDQTAVETTITGDFVICPLEPPQPGKLRLVRIQSARHLKISTNNWLEKRQ